MVGIMVKYMDLKDRAKKVQVQEAKKLRMLHDDFDEDWKSGDEPHGTMTFTDEPELVIEPEPVRDAFAEIDALKAKIAVLEKR